MTLTKFSWRRRGAMGASIVAVWLLASCSTPEQITQVNEEQCTSYGLQAGTTDFLACLTRQDLGERYFRSYVLPSQLSYY
jgi:hypothetical protein